MEIEGDGTINAQIHSSLSFILSYRFLNLNIFGRYLKNVFKNVHFRLSNSTDKSNNDILIDISHYFFIHRR